MHSQSIQVEKDTMCGQQLFQDRTQQVNPFHHDHSCHPGLCAFPEMHAFRSFTANTVGSSLSELVLSHEHNFCQPPQDLRVIADCCHMRNSSRLCSQRSIATEWHARAQEAVGSLAHVALALLRNKSHTGLILIDEHSDLVRWIHVLEVVVPRPQGGRLRNESGGPEKQKTGSQPFHKMLSNF